MADRAPPAGPTLVFTDAGEFAAASAPHGALLGLDLGTKTVGVAVSDLRRVVASPVETLKRTKFTADLERLRALMALHAAAGMVLGLPLNMDGSAGPRAQSSRAYARNLARETGLPVLLWDERLSTAAAEAALLLADTSRAKRAQVIDKMAATVILQGALDRLGNIQTP
ncbi:MAG: Holliday junction resolvase RuvX [Pseudomonadota bacterium]